jgi:hypothetical protein
MGKGGRILLNLPCQSKRNAVRENLFSFNL